VVSGLDNPPIYSFPLISRGCITSLSNVAHPSTYKHHGFQALVLTLTWAAPAFSLSVSLLASCVRRFVCTESSCLFNIHRNPAFSLSHSFELCRLHACFHQLVLSIFIHFHDVFKSILPISRQNHVSHTVGFEPIWPFPAAIVGRYLRPHTLMLPLSSNIMSCGRVVQDLMGRLA